MDLIYYTDNSLDPFLFKKCQEYLLKAAEGKRIISVSQKPLDFGDNICIGEVGRSHYNLFNQTLIGAEAATSKYIALAEHDCLYTPEHFNWIPPTDDLFYYNVNHWLVQWGGEYSGVYSYFRRKVMSNLICNRELYIEAIKEKLLMLEQGAEIRKGQAGACEPGVCDNRKAFIAAKAALKDVGKNTYSAKAFATELPNLDIRHGGNFSGGRRAQKRRFYLAPWGDFHSVMGVPPPGAWYQEAVINGVKMPQRRQRDTSLIRWQTFIEPFIEGEGTVTDLGCNAGFYCRQMADRGFMATGVEKNHEFLRHAYYWETQDPKGIKIVESDITAYPLTCANYVFLCNVHYWLTPEQLEELVARMREKVLNVLVIGRYMQRPEHQSPCNLAYLQDLFTGWNHGRVIAKGKHFSVLFTNPDLEAVNVDDIFMYQQLAKSKRFLPSYNDLIDLVLSGKEFDPKETEYWKYLQWRGHKNREHLLVRHIDLIKTMADTGIAEPLTIGRMVRGNYEPYRLSDGDHRLIVARKLGIKSLICRRQPQQKED